MRARNGTARCLALVMAAMFAGGAASQQFVHPAKGQSPEQQKKDEAQCHTWAVKQSKYDPANPPPSTAAAVVGGIMGDAGAGAAAGAVAARGQSRRQNAAQAQQQGEQASQQQQAGQQAYEKARSACLEGRGYTVK